MAMLAASIPGSVLDIVSADALMAAEVIIAAAEATFVAADDTLRPGYAAAVLRGPLARPAPARPAPVGAALVLVEACAAGVPDPCVRRVPELFVVVIRAPDLAADRRPDVREFPILFGTDLPRSGSSRTVFHDYGPSNRLPSEVRLRSE